MDCIKRTILSLLLALIVSAPFNAQKIEYAGMVLINGKIVTMDESKPRAEAAAVIGDKIIAVGTTVEIKKYIGPGTKIIDLKNSFVMPGIIESHAHFWGLGKFKKNIDLMNVKNWDEIVGMVKTAAGKAKPGEWILGRGWHQEKWNKTPEPNFEGYPYHEQLSKISPDNPVMLKHASGHAIIVNAKALELAGITEKTPNPQGGVITKDGSGKIVGVLHENAADPVELQYDQYLAKRTAGQKKADDVEIVELASNEALRKGITSFHDAGSTFEEVDLLKELAGNAKLNLRLYIMIGDSISKLKEKIKDYRLIGYGNNYLTVRAIKKYIDGALGARSAWFLEPYTDEPSQSGINVNTLEYLGEVADIAVKNGFQFCIHSIGDRGNREVLNIYENVYKSNPDKNDLRWRIEHAQHLNLSDIPRFAKLGIIAAMQPCHCTSDAGFVPKRIGDKRAEEGAYVWQKLMQSGAVICSGTDAPVEDVDPIKNFYSAVTRKSDNGKEFYPAQKMSRMEALKTFTVNGAYASFEEKIKGKISNGMLADFTVLSNDLTTCSKNDILKTKVLYTIVGGKIAYTSER